MSRENDLSSSFFDKASFFCRFLRKGCFIITFIVCNGNKKTKGIDRNFCCQSWSLCVIFFFFFFFFFIFFSLWKVHFIDFCISLFPSHVSRRWLKINLVSYRKKEIRSDIETCFIDRVLNNKHFYTQGMQKLCSKR